MTQTPTSTRIVLIDVLRGAALVAMAIYHFTWDLEFFGYAEPGLTAVGGWKFFARSIASSFLALAGFSLVLAHSREIRWPSFARRLAKVGAAAAAISIATYLAMPETFIFFGILHQIAVASVLGLAFLRAPWFVTAIAAALVIAAPSLLRTPLLDHPAWWWTGLSETLPRSNDYVPVFPWFGAGLAGMALAQLGRSTGALARLAAIAMPRWSRMLSLAGRYSLSVYLLHQPVLIAGVFLFSQLFPAASETAEVRFRLACETRCGQDRGEAFCAAYCLCMLDAVERNGFLDPLMAGRADAVMEQAVAAMAGTCTADIQSNSGGE
ncbi:DUF1624 domain-containing protein [Nitratireductor sp. CAU 1489]|uniref:DUF1624 domain-containing protein n=1 Tax=Nitratireductor arenosus TaxID=2682096 RepID=A0A844QJ06_9HYPH|nr:heparan-alpha-glucosaminide N-acetyltransferase [Nitratireductor arenosus]MVA97950.1 DUF1624 domain-containing protein [Nitratireductor arenosus]